MVLWDCSAFSTAMTFTPNMMNKVEVFLENDVNVNKIEFIEQE